MVCDVAFSPVDGNLLAIAGRDQRVGLWDVNRGLIAKHTLKQDHDGIITTKVAVEFSPDGAWLAVSIAACGIWALWNPESGTFKQPTLDVVGGVGLGVVALSPDGKLVASASSGNLVRLWGPAAIFDVADHLERDDSHSEAVNAVAVSACGRLIASASSDKTVKLWNPETGTCLATLVGHKNDVSAVAFSSNGQNLASATFDSTIIVWSMATRSVHHTLVTTGDFGYIAGLSWSPNGRLLVALHRSAVRLWDFTTRTRLHTLRGPPEMRSVAVAFSPDSRLIAAAFDQHFVNATARFLAWDAWTGEKILDCESPATASPSFRLLRWLYFDPAGTHLWTNLGSVELPRPVHFETSDSPAAAPADIYVWGNWIKYGERAILRLPSDHDSTASDFRAGILALGHRSGRVMILHLDEKAIPPS
jgi:WD40 repeat protein